MRFNESPGEPGSVSPSPDASPSSGPGETAGTSLAAWAELAAGAIGPNGWVRHGPPADTAGDGKVCGLHLISLDVDDTSARAVPSPSGVGDTDQVPPRLKTALARLDLTTTTMLAFCSGRSVPEMLRFLRECQPAGRDELAGDPWLAANPQLLNEVLNWKFSGYAAACNGALIMNATGEVLEVHGFSRTQLRDTHRIVRSALPAAVFAIDRAKLGSYDETFVSLLTDENYRHPWSNRCQKANVTALLDSAASESEFRAAAADGVVRIYALDPTMTRVQYEALKEALTGTAEVAFVPSQGLLEITAHGIHKGFGLSRIAEFAGQSGHAIDLGLAMHGGDNYNDKTGWAGSGFGFATRQEHHTAANIAAWSAAARTAAGELRLPEVDHSIADAAGQMTLGIGPAGTGDYLHDLQDGWVALPAPRSR